VRPVNLIPLEERHGEKAPLRTGPLPYLIVAALAFALVAVTLVVVTSNRIADRKAEKASLEAQVSQAQDEAERYRDFTAFASLQQAREATVTSLATSRFDWERVLRELAIVIPGDVWLTDLTAKASAAAGSSDTSSSATGSTGLESIEGPSLDIRGCAVGHDAVARFLTAMRDVDGVTRVTVLSSDRSISSDSTGGSSVSSGGASGAIACPSKDFISTFEVVAAFDGAAASAAATESATSASAPTSTTATSSTSTQVSAADQSQVVDGQDQLEQQRDSAVEKTDQGNKAVDTFIPGTGSAP